MAVKTLKPDKDEATFKFKLDGYDVRRYWSEEFARQPLAARQKSHHVWYHPENPDLPCAIYDGGAWVCDCYISEFRTGKANGLPGTVVTSVTRAFIAAAELARATGGIVLFDAAPGLGKTKGADYYLAQTRIAEGIGCPVWKIKLDPNGVSPLFVLRQIADEIIGSGKYDRRNAPEIANAIHAKAAGSRGLLIVDEAQELAKEPITGPKLLNTLRRFADEDTHCFGIMLMANGEIYHRYGQNEKFTQLYSRVHKRIEVFGLNDADEAARRMPPAPALQVADVRAIAAQWGIEDPEVIAWCAREAAKPGALRHLDKQLRGVLDDWGEITRASLQLAGVWS